MLVQISLSFQIPSQFWSSCSSTTIFWIQGSFLTNVLSPIRWKYRTQCSLLSTTVEPLTNDHPHQRPSLSYDHISCDGQWFLFVYESLTSDHPSYTTTPMWFWGWSYKRGSTVLSLGLVISLYSWNLLCQGDSKCASCVNVVMWGSIIHKTHSHLYNYIDYN